MPYNSPLSDWHEDEFSHLEGATESGDLSELPSLLEAGADPCAVDSGVEWPIATIAVYAANAEALSLLRSFGADIELADDSGVTTLARAASSTDGSESVEALLAAGADPTSPITVDGRPASSN